MQQHKTTGRPRIRIWASDDWSPDEPDSDTQVELHSSPDTPYITDPLRQVRSGIFDHANLEISLHRAVNDNQREILQQKQLTVTWTN